MSILLAAGGGYMAGVLLDKQSGDYQGVFILVFALAIASFACGLLMRVGVQFHKRSEE